MRQASVVRHDAHWTTARGLHLHNKRKALTSSSRHQIFNTKQLKRVMTFCFWFYIDHLVELKKIDRWSILCILKQIRSLSWFWCLRLFPVHRTSFIKGAKSPAVLPIKLHDGLYITIKSNFNWHQLNACCNFLNNVHSLISLFSLLSS